MNRLLYFLLIIFSVSVTAEQACYLLPTDGSKVTLAKGEKATLTKSASGPMMIMLFNELPFVAEVKYVISRTCTNSSENCLALQGSEFKMGVNTLERIIGDWQQECMSITNISLSPDAKLGLSLFSLVPDDQIPGIDEQPELLGNNIELNQMESRSMQLSSRYYQLELWAPKQATDFVVATENGYTIYSVRTLADSEENNQISTTKNYQTLTLESKQFLQIFNASKAPTQGSYFRLTDISCGTGCSMAGGI